MRTLIRNFLWYCATSNKEILEKCPTEHSKHALIGTLVLLTAVFAFISGSFAMRYMYETDPNGAIWAIGFGILWAILIFSLDRLLISTIRKDTGMPGKKYSKNKQGALVILRIALAVVISVVITKPLELWLYEDQINAQIVDNVRTKNDRDSDNLNSDLGISTLKDLKSSTKDQLNLLMDHLDNADLDTTYVQLNTAYQKAYTGYEQYKKDKEAEIKRQQKEIRDIESMQNHEYTQAVEYYDGLTGEYKYGIQLKPEAYDRVQRLKKAMENSRYQIAAKREDYKKKEKASEQYLSALRDSLNTQITFTKTDNEKATNRLSSNLRQKEAVMDSLKRINNAADRGIFGRIDILHQYNQSSMTRRAAGWFLFLIFLIIETAPIIAKMVSKVGPYDYALAALEYKKEQLEAQRKQLIDLTLLAQAEVAKKALEVWKEEQIQMVEDDPYSFVKEIKKRRRIL